MINYRLLNFLYRCRPLTRYAQHGSSVRPCQQLRTCSSHFTVDSSSQSPRTLTPTNKDIPPADHQSLGRALDLFSSTAYSAGSPLLHPDGSHIFLKLQSLLRAQHAHFGFREVVSPIIYKKSLWERSGHWDNYSDDMFEVTGRGARRAEDHQEKEMNEGESWGLKPMNCPGHCLLFGTKARSYRDLPVRYADFSPLHRNEVTGSLSGLTRIRRFHQDDGHIFCRADQVRDEISSTLQMIELVYGVFGLQPHKLLLSTRPDSGFIGLVEEWDQAERQLQEALEASNMQWALNAGDGAFYGPKIDVILRDNQDKEHQTATIQLDFQLPGRFELKYQSRPPHLVSTGSTTEVPLSYSTPILIHRAVLGSLERFLALLIEHYAGRFPLWLSPRQIKIVTTNTSESAVAHAKIVAAMLSGQHLSRDSSGSSPEPRLQPLAQPHTSYIVDVDAEPKTIGRKVASARKDKWCVICTVGNREAETGTVAVEFTLPKESSGLLEKKRAAKLRSVVGDICGDEGAAMKSMVMSLEKLKEVLDRLCAEWL